MTKLAAEAARLMDLLPPEKAKALIEYARFLAGYADAERAEMDALPPPLQPLETLTEEFVDEAIQRGRV